MLRIRLALLLSLCACSARNAPKTQKLPAAFNPTGSDEKAIKIADEVYTAVGGDHWLAAKEIIWSQYLVVDGKVVDVVKHAWDRWNGRHQFSRLDAGGSTAITMHDLFGSFNSAYLIDAEGHEMGAMAADTEKWTAEAQKRWAIDSYLLALPFKLKDPGVHLTFVEERVADGEPIDGPKKFDVIKVTFDPGVGATPGDVYYLVVAKDTHLIERIEGVPEGKTEKDRFGFKLDGWKEVGGVKFATQRIDLASYKADAPTAPPTVPPAWQTLVEVPPAPITTVGGVFLVLVHKVSASPDDNLYIPKVQ